MTLISDEGRHAAMVIRTADTHDAEMILGIYSYYVENSSATFECVPPALEVMRKRISEVLEAGYPYLVAEDENGVITGFAYAHSFRRGEAYRWYAETTIYLDKTQTSRGIGRKLYGKLLDSLAAQGVRTACAVITADNCVSGKFHLALGFGVCGTLHRAGYKHKAWHDVEIFEKVLDPSCSAPEK